MMSGASMCMRSRPQYIPVPMEHWNGFNACQLCCACVQCLPSCNMHSGADLMSSFRMCN